MPNFAANISMMFNEIGFLDRFEAASKAGFRAVEFLFPYEHPKGKLAEALKRNELELALHNMVPGDWTKGERGIACHPDRIAEFEANLPKAIEYATALKAPQVNCLAGIAPPGVAPEKLRETFVRNLKYAAPRLKDAGVRLVTEPINTRDIPGFYLNTSAQAESILDEVDSDNLFIQYDVYHMQIMEGDLAPTFERLLPKIRHVQIADTPGRHEPGTGEINYDFLFRHFDRVGYQGWIGCEYKPAAGTVDGLGWFEPFKKR